MSIKNKSLYGFLGLWILFSTSIGSDWLLSELFKLLNLEPSVVFNYIVSIIIFGLIITFLLNVDDEQKKQIENKFIPSVYFANNITKIDYSKLEVIENITLTELASINFTFKNGNNTNIKLNEITNMYSLEDIINLDTYLKRNCNLVELKNEKVKLSESIYLHRLINIYMNNNKKLEDVEKN